VAAATNWNMYNSDSMYTKKNSHEGRRISEQVAHRGCRKSTLGDIQNLIGYSLSNLL